MNANLKNNISILLLVCCPILRVTAQQTTNRSTVLSNIKKIETVWNTYYKTSEEHTHYLTTKESIRFLHTDDEVLKKNYIHEIDTYLALLDRNYQGKTGLELSGSYLNNFEPTFNDDANDVFFKNRVQVGINWSILKDGLVEHRKDHSAEKQKMLLKKLMITYEPELQNQLEKLDTLKTIFNEEKIKWLELKNACIKEEMTPYISLTAEYSTMKIPLLKLMSQSLQTEAELANCKEYNSYVKPATNTVPNNTTLPLLRIKPDFIFQVKQFTENSNDRKSDSIVNMTRKIMDDENNLASYVRLQAFLRYNYLDGYHRASLTNNFLSAGVSFAYPLFVSPKKVQQLNEEKVQMLKSELEYKNTNLAVQYHSLLSTYLDYQKKEAAYNELHEQEKLSRYKLELQQLRNKKYNYLFSPVEALEEFNRFLDLKIQMVDIKFDIYALLYKMQLETPGLNLEKYIDTVGTTQKTACKNMSATAPGMNSVYIWSSSLDNHSVNEILPFLKTNGFNEVIVSMKKDPVYLERLNGVIEELTANSISVQLMISDNKLLQQVTSEKDFLKPYDSFLSQVKNKVKAIHLDIEPHTLTDWKSRKEFYESAYLNLLLQAKKISSTYHLELNVSIPVFYEAGFLKKIYMNCNYVYLMAYEMKDLEKIKQKLNEEFEIDKRKSIVAIRANDFDSLKEMVLFSDDLKQFLEVDRIAFQDLSRIMKYTGN